VLSLLTMSLFLISAYSKSNIRILQFNIWQEGTMVKNGFDAIVNNIIALKPDFVTFSEVRNYNKVPFIPRLVSALKEKGLKYYGNVSVSTGIISKYKILSQQVVYPLLNDRGSVIKASILVGNRTIVVYSAHLDWLNCSSYLPRGYNSSTWKSLESPVFDIKEVLADNRASFRDDEITVLMKDAISERKKGRLIFIGGDFNEPSLLDWTVSTKDIREHKGLVVNWDCSKLLLGAGYKDSFREIYPDPLVNPGFTFPASNPDVPLGKLCWAPKSDDRERIDYIYYYPDRTLKLKNVQIVGPQGTIVYGKRLECDPDIKDKFVAPSGVWPTDHKALLATFMLQ